MSLSSELIMSSNVLKNRDVNTKSPTGLCKMDVDRKPDSKSMDYHRQIFQSRTDENQEKVTYVSPSDTIMSPCTAKLSAYRSKQVGKAKPKSLFAKTSNKTLESADTFFASSPVPKSNMTRAVEDTKA